MLMRFGICFFAVLVVMAIVKVADGNVPLIDKTHHHPLMLNEPPLMSPDQGFLQWNKATHPTTGLVRETTVNLASTPLLTSV